MDKVLVGSGIVLTILGLTLMPPLLIVGQLVISVGVLVHVVKD